MFSKKYNSRRRKQERSYFMRTAHNAVKFPGARVWLDVKVHFPGLSRELITIQYRLLEYATPTPHRGQDGSSKMAEETGMGSPEFHKRLLADTGQCPKIDNNNNILLQIRRGQGRSTSRVAEMLGVKKMSMLVFYVLLFIYLLEILSVLQGLRSGTHFLSYRHSVFPLKRRDARPRRSEPSGNRGTCDRLCHCLRPRLRPSVSSFVRARNRAER